MPIKASGTTDLRVIDRFEGGVGWIAYPEEAMERSSHAIVSDDEVWAVDPVDGEGVDDLLVDPGEVAGVLVLLDRHLRDADAVATRHDVAVHLPAWMRSIDGDIDAPVERFDAGEAGVDFELLTLVDNPFWQEAALYRQHDGLLYVPEAVGTSRYFRAGTERLGVHPLLRMTPPRRVTELTVDRLLVGHGAGVHDEAESALVEAISTARRRAPRAWMEGLRDVITG
jgi:hypothetical protein